MNDKIGKPGTLGLFKGWTVWGGIVMALGGMLAEDLSGGEHAFESFMFFGGLLLGMGLMNNVHQRKAQQSNSPLQSEGPAGHR